MNLEIANRLVALRKENNLSQEALAEKLGISRQAVSKWERAEASPDTDNLIALARLYHISLDELLRIHEENDDAEDLSRDGRKSESDMGTGEAYRMNDRQIGSETKGASYRTEADAQGDEDDVHIGFDGIHVKEKDGSEVHVGWRGIHVQDRKNDNEVHIDGNGIYVNGEEAKNHIFTRGEEAEFPLSIIAIVAYIVMGACFNLWHPGWLIFFLVPITGTLNRAVRCRNANLFAYPVLAALVFLYVGFIHAVWHPTWVVFLTIPVYYSIVGYIAQNFKKDAGEDKNEV